MNDFSHLRPGDVVALFGRHNTHDVRAVTVEKVGKVHLTLVGVDGKFQVRTGKEVGGSSSYLRRSIALMTPELKERCESDRLHAAAEKAIVELSRTHVTVPWTANDVAALSALVESRKSRDAKRGGG